MADGSPYSDDERVVLMLIFQYHAELAWHQATKVFNTVFKEKTRSQQSLVSAWFSRRNRDQKEAWNRLLDEPQAGHDLATRRQWLQTIDTAVAQLDIKPAVSQPDINPDVEELDQPGKKPQRPPALLWNHDMRLVLYLLIRDTSLDRNKRTAVFNALFRDVLANQGVAPVSRNALNSQWGHRKERRKDEDQDRQAEGTESTIAENWQRVINGPQTKEEQANVAKWNKAIKEQKISLGYPPDQQPSKKPQEGEKEICEHEPKGNQENFDMHEDGVPATALRESGGEAVTTEVGDQVNIQQVGSTAQEIGGGIVTPVQYRYQAQRAIVNDLHRSSPGDAAEVRRLFQQYNQSTLDLARLAVYLHQVNQTLQNRKRR